MYFFVFVEQHQLDTLKIRSGEDSNIEWENIKNTNVSPFWSSEGIENNNIHGSNIIFIFYLILYVIFVS